MGRQDEISWSFFLFFIHSSFGASTATSVHAPQSRIIARKIHVYIYATSLLRLAERRKYRSICIQGAIRGRKCHVPETLLSLREVGRPGLQLAR